MFDSGPSDPQPSGRVLNQGFFRIQKLVEKTFVPGSCHTELIVTSVRRRILSHVVGRRRPSSLRRPSTIIFATVVTHAEVTTKSDKIQKPQAPRTTSESVAPSEVVSLCMMPKPLKNQTADHPIASTDPIGSQGEMAASATREHQGQWQRVNRG